MKLNQKSDGKNNSLPDDHVERIWPTQETLSEHLEEFPDHRQRYEFAMKYVTGKVIADIACGAGYGSFMMGKGASSVHGFDISQEALLHAQQHFMGPNMNFQHASKLGNSTFDIVVSFETIEHMTEEAGDEFLKGLHSSLHEKGLLIISTPINRTKHRSNVTPYHLREYNEKEFADKLKANGFLVDRWYGQWNSCSEAIAKPIVCGISMGSILRSGLHRLVPKGIRRLLVDKLLGLELLNVNNTVRIVPDDLTGAAVQIAVCRRE